MPNLNEGMLLYMPTTLPGLSVTKAAELMQMQNRIIRSFPEVASVYGKAGRAATATDPAPTEMFETVVNLKPREQWRAGLTVDGLIADMTQGLLLFDAQARLVICNERYLEMFALSPETVKPGCHLRDLIQHRKETGTFVGDVDSYCQKFLDPKGEKAQDTVISVPDGRLIHLIYKRSPDGGWATTLEDITERRRVEARIERLAHYDALTNLPNRTLFQRHVEMADEALSIGPPAAAESYLVIDKIVEACRRTGAQAVHPGYGFLSEREAFPRALEKAGIVFIGPNPGAIAAMGDKIESKKAAAKAKVSTVPGHLGVIEDDKHVTRDPGRADCACASIGSLRSVAVIFVSGNSAAKTAVTAPVPAAISSRSRGLWPLMRCARSRA